jgi:hypothetical protein
MKQGLRRRSEPFKCWLAKVGFERIQEIENPELERLGARQCRYPESEAKVGNRVL